MQRLHSPRSWSRAVLIALTMVAAVTVLGPRSGLDPAAGASAPLVVSRDAQGNVVARYAYGTTSPEDQVGDVYYNDAWTAGSHPAIVVVHGGWWHNGNRHSEDAAARRFFGAGFVVYNIDYRLAADQQRPDGSVNPGDRWPAQRIDVELAVRFLKAHAATFGTASNRIASYGSSAGGHLVTLAAGYYHSVTVAASVSAVLQPQRAADIALNGRWGNDVATPTIVKSFGYVTSTIGCSYEPTWYNCGRKWRSFEPQKYFSASAPGVYAIKGALDAVEPASALTAIEYWLTRAGQDHRTLLVAGRGHDENIILGTTAADVTRCNALVTWIKARSR